MGIKISKATETRVEKGAYNHLTYTKRTNSI